MSHEYKYKHKPDPEVQAKATRRRFSAAYKQHIVSEAEHSPSLRDGLDRTPYVQICTTVSA